MRALLLWGVCSFGCGGESASMDATLRPDAARPFPCADPSLGTNGIVRERDGATGATPQLLGIDDRYLVSIGSTIRAYTVGGVIDNGFGSGGQLGVGGDGIAGTQGGFYVVGHGAGTLTVERWLASGQRDAGFPVGPLPLPFEVTPGFVVSADASGRLVVVATATDDQDTIVVRVLPDGTLDQSFGGVGWIRRPDGAAVPQAVAARMDGKVALTDTAGRVVQFDATGAVDTSFGQEGVVQIEHAILLPVLRGDADGRLVIGGSIRDPAPEQVFAARLLADGQPDPSFGQGGRVVAATGDADVQAYDVAIAPNGDVVFVGVGLAYYPRPEGTTIVLVAHYVRTTNTGELKCSGSLLGGDGVSSWSGLAMLDDSTAFVVGWAQPDELDFDHRDLLFAHFPP